MSTWFSCRAKEGTTPFSCTLLRTMLTVLLGAGHWLGQRELQMACSCTFKISFLTKVQHSRTLFPFRIASQGTLPTRLLKRLKSALQKVKWQGGLSLFLQELKTLPLHDCCTQDGFHCITHQSFSVHKHQTQWMPSLVVTLTSCVKSSLPHTPGTSWTVSSLLCLQQTPGKLKFPTRKRANK